MITTKIYLAGIAKVVGRDGRATLLSRKGAAFLAYLALQGHASRSTISGLLWPALPEAAARANLRELARRVNAKVGACCVVEDGETLHLDASTWVDFLDDPDGVDGRRFLAGYVYDDCPMLAAWLRSERDGLRRLQTSRLLEELISTAPSPRTSSA